MRRAAGRRRLRLVASGLTAVVLAVAAWGATRSPLLDVDRIVVEGAAHTGDAAVRTAAAIPRGRALTDVDGVRTARRVSTLPWVLRADVVREWPSTVRIRVVERGVTAVTREAGAAWVLVDRVGRVLAPVAAPPPGVAIVDGVPPAGPAGTRMSAAARGALEVAAELPPGLAPRVATVTLGTNGIELRLKPQGVVLLGGGPAPRSGTEPAPRSGTEPASRSGTNGVADKLRAALTVLAAVDGRTVATLDVRIPATPVLTRL